MDPSQPPEREYDEPDAPVIRRPAPVRPARADRLGLALIAPGLVCMTVTLAWWPGLLTPDANQTIAQASAGVWVDWWTPFGAFMTRQLFLMEFGVGTLFAIQTLGLLAALYLLMRIVFRRVPAGVAVALISWVPIVWIQYSALSRDTYSLALSVLAFAGLGHVVARPAMPIRDARRWAALAVVSAIGSFLFRQNAIVVLFVVVAALALPWLAARRSWTAPRRALAATATGAAASIFVLLVTGVVYGWTGVHRVHPERPTLVYDIAAISVASDRDYLPDEARALRPGRITPALSELADLKRNFRYENVVSLYPPEPPVQFDFGDEELAAQEYALLRPAWWRAVREHPIDYVVARLRLTAVQLGIVRRPKVVYYGLLDPKNFGHPLLFAHGFTAASGVATAFVGPGAVLPLDITWTHLVVLIAGLVLLRRRGSAMAPLVGWMLGAALLNLVALGIVAMAGAARYNNLLPVVALVSLAFLAAERPRLAGARRDD